nr:MULTISPECIES: hypothetical protein [unclassified Pseudoflavonifractor]
MEVMAVVALGCVTVAGIVSVTAIAGFALVCMLGIVTDVVKNGE